MNRAGVFLAAIFCLMSLSGCVGSSSDTSKANAESYTRSNGLRYSIGVAKFENRSNWSGQWDLGSAWGAVLTDTLQQSNRFIVLGEKDMRVEAMNEQDFAMSGRAAGGGKTVVTGQMTPAQLLVKGVITHFAEDTGGTDGGIGFAGVSLGGSYSSAEINVTLYIIDSSTGQVMASKKCYGKVSKKGLRVGYDVSGWSGNLGSFKKSNAGKAVEKAVHEGVRFLVGQLEQIPWTGKIVMVKGPTVYINRGEREGVTAGQKFTVGEAVVLRDPDTGEILDQSIEKTGTLEVLKVKDKISICKVVTGNGIRKGMTIMQAEI